MEKNFKKNFTAPFHGWGSTASRLEPLRGGSLSFQKFLVLILSTSEGWKAESTLEPPSGFWNTGPLDWESSALTTRPLLHEVILISIELFWLFIAYSYKSMESTALSCSFSWVVYGMPKVLRDNKLPISLQRVEWFCWFFACSYLYFVRYPLKLQKYAILGWQCQAWTLSQSDCQIF